MLHYYQELTLIPTPDISLNIIWAKIFQQIHLALANAMQGKEKGQIGVSFPQYQNEEKVTLGYKVRFFAPTESVLLDFQVKQFLYRYEDYFRLTAIRPLPKNLHGYENYQRFHRENSQAQKARRYAKRHDVSVEEALKLFPADHWGKELPYIQLKSLTNQNRYLLYIKKTTCPNDSDQGFNSYGLDSQSTVPAF